MQTLSHWIFIVVAWTNIYLQSRGDPHSVTCEYFMLFWIIMAVIETLLFLKVIESFTPVVTMMISVIGNLWDFMVFYFICLLFLGIVLPVFGLDKNEEYVQARAEVKSSGDGRDFAGYEY